MGAARGHFARLRLRTDSPDAAGFYRSLDFMPFTAGPAYSHQIVLAAESGVSAPAEGRRSVEQGEFRLLEGQDRFW
jgi:hypothetical protein